MVHPGTSLVLIFKLSNKPCIKWTADNHETEASKNKPIIKRQRILKLVSLKNVGKWLLQHKLWTQSQKKDQLSITVLLGEESDLPIAEEFLALHQISQAYQAVNTKDLKAVPQHMTPLWDSVQSKGCTTYWPDLCQEVHGKEIPFATSSLNMCRSLQGWEKPWSKFLDADEHSRLQMWKLIWVDGSCQSIESVILRSNWNCQYKQSVTLYQETSLLTKINNKSLGLKLKMYSKNINSASGV